MKNEPHKFKWVNCNGDKVRIDRNIAPLISNMWKLGIGTTNCCQSVCAPSCKHKNRDIIYKDGSKLQSFYRTKHCGDRIWIVFDSGMSLEKFLNIVAVFEEENDGSNDIGMYGFIHGYCPLKYPNDIWHIDLSFRNNGVDFASRRVKQRLASGTKQKTISILKEISCKNNDFRILPHLYFPSEHLSYVEGKIILANENKNRIIKERGATNDRKC